MSPLHIGLTIRLFTPASGGLQQHAQRLAESLRSRGHRVSIATRAVSRSPSYRDLYLFSESEAADRRAAGVHLLRHSSTAFPLLWFVMKAAARPRLHAAAAWAWSAVYRRQLNRAFANVDVIHHVGQAPEMIGFGAGRLARRRRIPFLVQPTAHPGFWGDGSLDMRLYAHADRLLAHTQFEKEWLTTRLDTPVGVVGNGIDDRADGDGMRFRKQHGITGPLILFLGRKEPDKGYPLVRDAFARVRPQFPEATLVCAGPGAASARADGVLELEYLDEGAKHDALAACTALCVPSEAESFGLVYMEAGLYAKPVIARDIPVLRELIGDRGGVLVPSHDEHEVLSGHVAGAIAGLLADPGAAGRFGQGMLRISREFVWPRVVQNFEREYLAALSERLTR